MHPKSAQHPGGLKFMVKTKDALTQKDREVETVVNRKTCLEYYKNFEFTVKEWSRINGLKRKQTSKFKKLIAKKKDGSKTKPTPTKSTGNKTHSRAPNPFVPGSEMSRSIE